MHPMKKNKLALILILLSYSFTLQAEVTITLPKINEPIASLSTTLSDISIDSFEKDKLSPDARNPFSPASVGEGSQAALTLEGIILGPSTTLCLVSGQVLKEGNRFGNSLVKAIHPGEVIIQTLDGERYLRMDQYTAERKDTGAAYEIYFQNAALESALHMIATAGNLNMIMPDNVEGRVSLIFHQTLLKDALGAILRVNGLEYTEENQIVRIDKPDLIGGGASIETSQIPLKYATAKDLVAVIKPLLSDKGTVIADERTNTLSVKDKEAIIEDVWAVVHAMDMKDPQVLIEAKILDVTNNFSRSLGIQWGFTRDSGNVQGFGGAGSSSNTSSPFNVNLPAGTPTSGMGVLIGNLISNTSLEAQLSAAETNGDIHIISRPSVSTLNNMPAKIRSGVKIYVKSTSSINVGTSGASASGDSAALQEIDTGVDLTVTPQITSGDMIKMKIEAVESEADFSRKVDGIPAIIDNTATTTVLVRNGQTTVIGGLVKARKSTQVDGVPGISSVPVVGWLFKNKEKTRTDNELLILITPKIVQEGSAEDAAQLEHFNQAVQKMYPTPPPAKEKKSSGGKTYIKNYNQKN